MENIYLLSVPHNYFESYEDTVKCANALKQWLKRSVLAENQDTYILFGISRNSVKYGSVKAPIIAHVVANVFSVLATHFKTFDWIMADQMRGGIITVVCASIAASMYVFIQRMDDETE